MAVNLLEEQEEECFLFVFEPPQKIEQKEISQFDPKADILFTDEYIKEVVKLEAEELRREEEAYARNASRRRRRYKNGYGSDDEGLEDTDEDEYYSQNYYTSPCTCEKCRANTIVREGATAATVKSTTSYAQPSYTLVQYDLSD